MDIDREINSLIKSSSRTWGIYAENLDTGKLFELNKDKVFESASIIKVLILFALFKKAEDEHIGLGTSLRVKDKKDDLGSGVIKHFDLSQPIPIYNLALLMIVISDNIATNVLIDYLGINYINHYIESIGLSKTKLLTKRVSFPTKFRLKNTKMGKTTPFEIAKALKDLEENMLFDKKTSNKIVKILSEQLYTDDIPRFLPAYGEAGMKAAKVKKIANKTGSIVYEHDQFFSIKADAALIYTKDKKRLVITIFHQGINDNKYLFSTDNPYNTIASKISLLLFNYLI